MFNSKKLLALISLFLITVCLFTSCGSSPDSPEEVIEIFEEALNDRDAQALFDIAQDARLGGSTSVEKYEDFIDKFESNYGEDFTVKLEILDVEYEEDDYAKLQIKAVFESSTGDDSFEDTFSTEKVDGKWWWVD